MHLWQNGAHRSVINSSLAVHEDRFPSWICLPQSNDTGSPPYQYSRWNGIASVRSNFLPLCIHPVIIFFFLLSFFFFCFWFSFLVFFSPSFTLRLSVWSLPLSVCVSFFSFFFCVLPSLYFFSFSLSLFFFFFFGSNYPPLSPPLPLLSPLTPILSLSLPVSGSVSLFLSLSVCLSLWHWM